MRVFLDANILFSAAKSDGAVRALVSLLCDRGHECWVDAYVVAEARRNLASKGPQAVQVLQALLGRLQIAPAALVTGAAVELDWLPPKDRPVLAAAIAGHRAARPLVAVGRGEARPAYRDLLHRRPREADGRPISRRLGPGGPRGLA